MVDWVVVGAVAGVVTALGTVAMAIAVVITAVIAARTLRAARDDSRARTRPTIVAELRAELLSHGTTLLVVRNLGPSVAKNVVLRIDPGPTGNVDAMADSETWKWVYQRYATPITSWPPGWTLSNVVRAGHDALPLIKIHTAYDGPDGTSYADTYDLHPDHILKETSAGPSKTTDAMKLEQHKLAALQALVRAVAAK